MSETLFGGYLGIDYLNRTMLILNKLIILLPTKLFFLQIDSNVIILVFFKYKARVYQSILLLKTFFSLFLT